MRFPATVLFAMALTAQAHAYPTLSYDSPVIEAAPAEVIPITAVLTLGPSDGAISTDMIGASYADFGEGFLRLVSLIYVNQVDGFGFYINGVFEGTPGGPFPGSLWTPPAINPLGNLVLNPGQSIDLNLGTITLDSTIPAGTYSTDIGIYNGCLYTCRAFGPGQLPDYADAGLLTITVVPEPASAMLMLTGLAALVTSRRKR